MTQIEVFDEDRLILKLHTPTGNLHFQAPSDEIMRSAKEKLEEYLNVFQTKFTAHARSSMYVECHVSVYES